MPSEESSKVEATVLAGRVLCSGWREDLCSGDRCVLCSVSQIGGEAVGSASKVDCVVLCSPNRVIGAVLRSASKVTAGVLCSEIKLAGKANSGAGKVVDIVSKSLCSGSLSFAEK